MGVLQDVTSLDSPVAVGEDAVRVGDLVADEQASRVGEEVVEQTEMAQLFETLAHLPERARRVLLRRYGLDPATLRALRRAWGIARAGQAAATRRRAQAAEFGDGSGPGGIRRERPAEREARGQARMTV